MISNIDVLVVGCGVAGLRASIAAATQGARTFVVGESRGASALSLADVSACGDQLNELGFAGESDSIDEYCDEVLRASFQVAEYSRVRQHADGAGNEIASLLELGVQPLGRLGRRSLLIPGAQILLALRAKAEDLGVKFLNGFSALGLLQADEGIAGAVITDATQGVRSVQASSTVLATGGYHQVHKFTTGGNCGNCLSQAWALRAGASLLNMEAISFCPYVVRNPRFAGSILPYLLSQFVHFRLYESGGIDVTSNVVPYAELAQRNGEWDKLVATRRIAKLRSHGGPDSDGLRFVPDIPITEDDNRFHIASALPNVRKLATELIAAWYEIDEPVTVDVAAHYSCGGIKSNIDGSTVVPGLFACGEVAVGPFGMHRTMSSITDCLVTGSAAGVSASRFAKKTKSSEIRRVSPPLWHPAEAVRTCREITSRALGPNRCQETLSSAQEELCRLGDRCQGGELLPTHAYAADLLLLSKATVAAAIERKDSRGFHYRTENPCLDDSEAGQTRVYLEAGDIRVTREPSAGKNLKAVSYERYVESCLQI